MQTSTITYKNLNPELRIDAEYYRAEVLDKLESLANKNHDSLGDIASFVVGPFGSTVKVEQYVEKSEFRYIRNKDINDFSIGDNDPSLIPEAVFSSLPQFHIREGDLLITVVGTLGKVAIARKKDTKSIFSCKSTIIRVKGIDPYYLLTYLNSKTGQIFALRGMRGAIQQGLNLSDLKEINVYMASPKMQQQIKDIVAFAFKSSEMANQLYQQAEQILLSELGLINWKPEHQLSFVKSYSDTNSANRIDAEYFQPIYDELLEKVKQYRSGYKPLGDIVKIKDKNFVPKDDITYKYIELANISVNGNVNGFTEAEGKELPSRARRKVNIGDIIVSSIEGSLSSIALINGDLNDALCSTGFYVVNSDTINSETLLVLLKSLIGQLQLKKGCSGTILTAINNEGFKRVLLPNISASIQEEIRRNISEMYKAKSASKKLLDIAKRGVEMAIEKSEEEATKWLTEEEKQVIKASLAKTVA